MNNIEYLLKYITTTTVETEEVVDTISIPLFKPTTHQLEKLQQLALWFESDNLFIVLNGAAGTGKTSIINFFIDNLTNYNQILEINKTISSSSICVAAPTHKALGVIRNKIDRNVDFNTVASLVGLRPDTSLELFDPTNVEFTTSATEVMAQYDIIIIDEASMINSKVLDTIYKISNKNNIKILFVGDDIQLPPVGEYLSGVFNNTTITLTEIIRQKDTNPIVYLLAILRNDIINAINSEDTNLNYNFIAALQQQLENVNDKKEGYKCIKYEDILSYLNIFDEDTVNVKYITYTNKDVYNNNRIIRNYLYPNSKSFIERNELFMAYNTITDSELHTSLINSVDYKILDVEQTSIFFNYVEFKVKSYNARYGDYKSNRLVYCKPEQFKVENGVEFNGYKVLIQNTITEATQTIFVPDKSEYNKIAQEHFAYFNDNNKGFKHFQLKKIYGTYIQFRSKFTLITPIYICNGQYIHYDTTGAVEIIKKDLDRGYAITAHKSQGSTYSSSIVNIKEILAALKTAINPDIYYARNNKPISKELIKNEIIFHLKLIYVALSRVTKISYIIIK